MATAIPDLWPTDFGDPSTPSPAGVLRQQGLLLAQKTKNFVLGKVFTRADNGKTFEHTFALSAPLLGFERPILSATHGLALYPVRIAMDPVICAGDNPSGEVREVATADEFLTALGEIFKSEPTKSVIRSLLAQSQGRPSANAG